VAYPVNDNFYPGAAFVFRQGSAGKGWVQEAKLLASDWEEGDRFGRSVSFLGDFALIGAYRDRDAGYNSGAAYIFRCDSGAWIEEAKLTAHDAAVEDRFGIDVAFSEDFALIGAYQDDDAGEDSGSVYVFDVSGASCGPMIPAGPGPSHENPPRVRAFPPEQNANHEYEFEAYGVPHFGVHLTCGEVTGDGYDKIITGPGPGSIFGPHVRGFQVTGTPLPDLNFMAYGTSKWGVHVSCGDIDHDGFEEIITGPGPGAVFGPRVRAFDYDGTSSVTPVPGVSFMAYGIRKWGINVSAGDIDGDGFDEIITGPGPGPVFGPHVRGWNVDGGPAEAITAASFFAYGIKRFGVVVSSGNLDGDGFDEMITAPGPSRAFSSHIRGWDYDDSSVAPVPGCNFIAWDPSETRYGARVFSGADLDSDGCDELVAGCGPDPAAGSPVKVFNYDDEEVTEWFSFQAFPSGWTHGTHVAAGRFLFLQ